MVKDLLKQLLHSNSDSIMELEYQFHAQYPEEYSIIEKLRKYVHSEESEITDSELSSEILSFMEGKV